MSDNCLENIRRAENGWKHEMSTQQPSGNGYSHALKTSHAGVKHF